MRERDRSVLPHPAREPRRDLLEQPLIAIRVVEGRVSLIGATLRVTAGDTPAGQMEHLADVGAVFYEVLTRCVNITNGQQQALSGTGRRCGQALPERDRAFGVRGGQLDDPEVVTDDDIRVQPPPEPLVERFGPVDIETGNVTTSSFRSTVAGSGPVEAPVLSPLLLMLTSVGRTVFGNSVSFWTRRSHIPRSPRIEAPSGRAFSNWAPSSSKSSSKGAEKPLLHPESPAPPGTGPGGRRLALGGRRLALGGRRLALGGR